MASVHGEEPGVDRVPVPGGAAVHRQGPQHRALVPVGAGFQVQTLLWWPCQVTEVMPVSMDLGRGVGDYDLAGLWGPRLPSQREGTPRRPCAVEVKSVDSKARQTGSRSQLWCLFAV